MPQELSQEARTKINRALLLEKAGKLTAAQQESLNTLRQRGIAPPPLSKDISSEQKPIKKPVDPLYAARVGFNPETEELPEIQNPSESLPTLGATAGAALGSPSGPGAIGGAMLGGAAGEGARQIINRATGFGDSAETGGEAAGKMAVESLVQGTVEGLVRGGFGLVRFGKNVLKGKVPAKKASDFIANEISTSNLSPAQTGEVIKKIFDAVQKQEGEALGAITSKFKKIVERPSTNNSVKVLNEEIALLERSPDATREGSKLNSLLNVLKEERALLTSPATQNIGRTTGFTRTGEPIQEAVPTGKPTIDDLLRSRSRFSQAARDYGDEKEVRRISGRLSEASHQDIVSNLEKSGEAELAKEFGTASASFRKVREKAEVETLIKVWGVARVSDDKVVATLAKAPEESIRAIKLLKEKAKDNLVSELKAEGIKVEDALPNLRRAIFKQYFRKGELPKLDVDVVREVFGPQAKKVEKFGELLAKAEKGQGLRSLLTFISTKVGPQRFGVNVPGSGTILEVNANELARILDKPQVLDTFIEAFDKAPTGAGAAQLLRVLGDAFSEETRRSGIATIREQLESKRSKQEAERKSQVSITP